MGILDAPARPFRSNETITFYGHSFTQITVLQPSTTLASAVSAGEGAIEVASILPLQVDHNYTLCDALSYQNGENVWIKNISGTTVTFRDPLNRDRASGALLLDHSYMCGRRFAKMIGSPPQFTNRGVGGASLCQGGVPTSAGGFNAVWQLHPKPPNVYGDPSAGVNVTLWGINDISATHITDSGGGQTGIDAIVEAGRHAYRAVQARFNLVVLYEAETAFSASAINTTFAGSGSWVVQTGSTFNTGTGYRTNTSSGATVTHALPESVSTFGVTDRIIDFCFIADETGGTTTPGSTITFTIDGTEVFPIGGNSSGPYSASNRFSTSPGTQASGFNTQLPCVARLQTDGAAHSIVATAGTGGMTLDWIGYEADYCSPTIHTNVCVTPSVVGAPSEDAVPYWNTMLEEVVAEFDSPFVKIADMYTALSPGDVPSLRSWNTSLDGTHPNIYGNSLIAQEMYKAYNRMPINNTVGADL